MVRSHSRERRTAEFLGTDDRERRDRRLRRAVVAVTEVRVQTRRRGGVDDRCPTGSSAFARSRQCVTACLIMSQVPLRCTWTTESNSSSVIETSVRSRRIPALFTSVCRPPKVSIAAATIDFAPSQVATEAPFATARPPNSAISSTTSWAGPTSPPSPTWLPPRSLTTTLTPSRAINSACSRPTPRPAPVTMTTRPSSTPTVPLAVGPDTVRQPPIQPRIGHRHASASEEDVRATDHLTDFSVTTVNQEGGAVITGTATARLDS